MKGCNEFIKFNNFITKSLSFGQIENIWPSKWISFFLNYSNCIVHFSALPYLLSDNCCFTLKMKVWVTQMSPKEFKINPIFPKKFPISFLMLLHSSEDSTWLPKSQYGSLSPQYSSLNRQYISLIHPLSPRNGFQSPQYGSLSPQYGSLSPQYGSLSP